MHALMSLMNMDPNYGDGYSNMAHQAPHQAFRFLLRLSCDLEQYGGHNAIYPANGASISSVPTLVSSHTLARGLARNGVNIYSIIPP